MELAAKNLFFLEINSELADKGFFVTSTAQMITWAGQGRCIG
jgi:NADH-quinone oxidoreductase subunit B